MTIYYAVTSYHVDEILDQLENTDCREEELVEIEDLLLHNQYNIGFTYSNFRNKCSVIVIGLTSSPDEFQNTFDHEKGHLAMHICSAYEIDPFGEEYQYLTGEIGQKMFKIARRFLCEHCRNSLISEKEAK